MIKKILYLILLAVVFFLSVMYRVESVRFLLTFLVILPVVLWISLRFMKQGVHVKLGTPQEQIQKGDFWAAELAIENKSWIPAPVIGIDLEYLEMQTGKREKIKVWGNARKHGHTKVICKKEEKYCGKIQLSMTSVRVYDLLGLFSARIPAKGQAEIKILPTLYMTEVTAKPVVRPQESDFCEYDLSRPGNDVSEIFQIREYQAGDTLHRIHWKLSARADDVLVKDYSYPLGYRACLYLDFSMPPAEKNLRQKMDGIIQLGMALSFSMFVNKCPHFLVWTTEEGHLERYGVRTEEHLYEAMEAVMQAKIHSGQKDWKDQYRQQFVDEIPEVRLSVNHKLEVIKKDEVLMQFHTDEMENELETFRLEI